MTATVFDRPIAHRGLHARDAGVIENSAAAFEAAIARGFGIECDLQLTGDGEVVVFHDHDLKRLVGRDGSIHTISADTLGSATLLDSADGNRPQRFKAFLEQIDGRAPLVIEIKQQPTAQGNRTIAQKAVALAAGYRGLYVFKSFDPSILNAVRKAGYTGPLGIITYAYDKPEWYGDMKASTRFLLRHLLHWPYSRFTFISCERTALVLPAVRLFRMLGMKVMSWTVKSSGDAAEVLTKADQIVFEGFDPEQ